MKVKFSLNRKFWIVFFFIFLIFILFLLIKLSNKLLTKQNPLPDADILVIEGWLQPLAIEELVSHTDFSKYKQIVITGFSKQDYNFQDNLMNNDPYRFHMCLGSKELMLNSHGLVKLNQIDTIQSFTLYSESHEFMSNFPAISIYINKECLGSIFIDKPVKGMTLNRLSHYENFNDFLIFFINDASICDEGRNISIDSIHINHLSLNAQDDFYIIEDHRAMELAMKNNANLMKSYLHLLGVKKPIEVLDTIFNGRNHTKAAAVKLKQWMHKKSFSLHKFNIVSYKYHSRRSYMTYSNLFNKNSFGMISLQRYYLNPGCNNEWYKFLVTVFDEYLSCSYIKLFE